MIYGIAALAAGVPAWLAQLASAMVFAGAAQLVIVQMLAAGAGFMPIALTSGLLNLRHVLYSASMAEYVRHLPRRWRLLLAYVLTDEAYAVAVLRYQQRHAATADHGVNGADSGSTPGRGTTPRTPTCATGTSSAPASRCGRAGSCPPPPACCSAPPSRPSGSSTSPCR